RASYAIRKFEHLSTVLNIKDIEEHVNHNVEELVTFVQFFASMKLEDELNKVGLVVGFVALAVAGPSFLSDYRAFFIETFGWPEWTEWVVGGFLAVLALGLIVSLLFPGWLDKLARRLFSRRQDAGAV
ncbi:MAG TPA: hypothetical protein VHO49_08375, partial [Anaerolineales bacterium]|nr:hypothetical protein [Anaerolineales bacterium]